MIEDSSASRSQRDALAKQLRDVRRYEKMVEPLKAIDGYTLNRKDSEYVSLLSGIEQTLKYLLALSQETNSRVVVDTGTGHGQAWQDLATSPLNPGLEFEATALNMSKLLRKVWEGGRVKVRITTAERMRGYKPESVLGVFAVSSLTYVLDQPTVARKLDEILVPGGVIKAVYPPFPGSIHTHGSDDYSMPDLKVWTAFQSELRILGYDIKTMNRTNKGGAAVILAIKPGGEVPVKAKELLKADLDDYERQNHQLKAWHAQQS